MSRLLTMEKSVRTVIDWANSIAGATQEVHQALGMQDTAAGLLMPSAGASDFAQMRSSLLG